MTGVGDREGVDGTSRGGDCAPASRKSVSLAKTMRPGLLGVVQRTKLFERMDQGAERGIIWVAGPPGAGKTTLVSSYLERRRLNHLWYQVDRGDVDAATFFHYMGLAASRVPSLDGGVLPAFASGRDGDVPAFSRAYFRELYRHLVSPFALVFDNYQEAPLQSSLSLIINTALEEIPRGGSVVVISRSEPPRELARLRANQRIEIIGWPDLRLTPDELRKMARMRGQTLTEDASRTLHHHTQGWAAGAVLMLEHAKIMGAEAELPSDDTPQVIFDYVAGEIFDKFESTTREFLLSTSCMSQLTPDTARKVSGYSKAGPLLANLARNDYFVSERHVDGERVYQFHRLLSAFLRTRARLAYAPEEWTKLVHRSGRLLGEAGQVDDAVSLLLDEEHWEQATELIVAHAQAILAQGRAETLLGWLDELPPSIASASPWVLYWHGSCRHGNAPRTSRRFYERAYAAFCEASTPAPEGMVFACCGIIDAIVSELDDFSLLDPWIEALETVWSGQRRTLPEHAVHRAARSMLTALLLRRPGSAEFGEWLEAALDLWRRNPDDATRNTIGPGAALALMWLGRYPQAAEAVDAARSASKGQDLPGDGGTLLAYAEMAQALFAGFVIEPDGPRGDPPEADSVDEGRRSRAQPIHRAIARLNEGDLRAAEAALDEASTASGAVPRLERGLQQYLRAWLSMCRGDRIDAYRHAQTALSLASEIGSPGFELLCCLAWAETLAACGDARKAEAQIRSANESLPTIGSPLLEMMFHFAAARVALDGDRCDDATNALEKALSLGRRHGFTHTLWWRPGPMAELCAVALAADVEADYVRHLIRSRGLVPDDSATFPRSWPWPFQIFTLGKFRLLVEGETQSIVSKGSKRPLELLKVLVAMGGRDVRAEHLADILWPHKDGDYAYGSLTSALHRLRRLLGVDDAVVLKDGRMSLNARYVWVDTWAVELIFSAADRDVGIAVSRRSLAATANRLLELYRGAFLEDEFESTCYIALREHLRGKMSRLLNKIARQTLKPVEVEGIAGLFERAIDADPLCEEFYRGLVTFYAGQDRRAEALDVYNRCRSTLASTLGVAPSPEMASLYEKLSDENTVS